MRPILPAVCLDLALILMIRCGSIGPVQYPARNIPVHVSDLSAIERGNQLDVNFTIPALTTEGLPLKAIGPIELRVGPAPAGGFHIQSWAEFATPFKVPPPGKPGPVHTVVPVQGFVGRDVIVAVRIANPKDVFSEWSNLVTVPVAAPLSTPADLTATPVPDGVLLKWQPGNATQFHIYRDSQNSPQPAVIGASDKPEYLDNTTTYGVKYDYYIEAFNADATSQTAGPATVTPIDVFPPAVPSGIVATSGLNSVELDWNRNTESDFRGYRIYRSAAGGPFVRIADLVEAPNYSDRAVESGKKYSYEISSVDQLGHESDKSAPVEATAP